MKKVGSSGIWRSARTNINVCDNLRWLSTIQFFAFLGSAVGVNKIFFSQLSPPKHSLFFYSSYLWNISCECCQIYVLPIIILVGTVGNALSFAVFLRSCLARRTSVHFYLILLASADTTVLYVSAFKTWIRVLAGAEYELLHVSDVSCRLMTYVMLVAFHLAAWVLVLITLDRWHDSYLIKPTIPYLQYLIYSTLSTVPYLQYLIYSTLSTVPYLQYLESNRSLMLVIYA